MGVALIAFGGCVGFFGAMVLDEYRRQSVRSHRQRVLLQVADSLVKDSDAGPFRPEDLNALANALRSAARANAGDASGQLAR